MRVSGGKINRILVKTLLIISCLALVAAGCVLFITSNPGERLLRDFIESKLVASTGLEVRIGSLETNLFSYIVIRDILVSTGSPSDTSGTDLTHPLDLLNLSRLRIEFALLDILKKPVVIKDVDVSGLKLSFLLLENEKTNLPPFVSGDSDGDAPSGKSFGIEIRRSRISKSSITYSDRSHGGITEAGVLLEADLLMQPDGRYTYKISGWDGSLSDSLFAFSEADILISGTFAGDHIGIDSLSAFLPGLSVAASGRLTRKGKDASIMGRLLIESDLGILSDLTRGTLAERSSDTEGLLRLAAVAEGSANDPSLSWTVDIPQFKSGYLEMNGTFCRGIIAGGVLETDSLFTSVLGGSLDGSISMSLDSLLQTNTELRGRGLNVSKILTLLNGREIDYTGSADLSMKLSGSLTDPYNWAVSSNAGFHGLVYGGRKAPPFDIQAAMESGDFTLDITQGGSLASLQGTTSDGSVDSRFSVDILDLGPLAAMAGFSGLEGYLASSGTIDGDISSPSVEAEINGGNISYRGVPLDTLSCHASFSGGALALRDVRFSGSNNSAGRADTFELIRGFRGTVSYSGRLESYPDEMNGEMHLLLDKASYKGYELDEGRAEIYLTPDSLRLENLLFKFDSLAVYAGGGYNIEIGRGELNARLIRTLNQNDEELLLRDEAPTGNSPAVQGISTRDTRSAGTFRVGLEKIAGRNSAISIAARNIDLDTAARLSSLEHRIGGIADIDIGIRGIPDSLKASGKIRLEHPVFNEAEFDSVSALFEYSAHSFYLDTLLVFQGMNSAFAETRLDISAGEPGSKGISGSSRFIGRVMADGLDLSAVSGFLPVKSDIKGSLTADLSWNGTLESPHLYGDLKITGGSLRIKGTDAELTGIEMVTKLEDSVFHLENLSGSLLEVPMKAKGEFRRAGDSGIGVMLDLSLAGHGDVTASGFLSADSLDCSADIDSLDLSLLGPFLPSFKNISGMMDARIRAAGHPRNPRMDGRLNARDLTVSTSAMDFPVSGGTIDLSFDKTTVAIDSLSFKLADGSVFLSGEVSIGKSGPGDFDLACTARNLNLKDKSLYSANLRSAAVTLKTINDYHLLDGDIVLGESKITARFKPQSILPFTKSLEKSSQNVPAFLTKMRLNLRIRAAEGLWLDNNLARLQLDTSINIIGFASSPNASGRLTVKKGYLLFIDRKLQITEGVVDFIDPNRLDPIIDITATTKVKNYNGITATPYSITLSVKGKLEEAQVSLTSVPPLERTDIISLLAVGKVRSQIFVSGDDTGESSVTGVILQRARQLTSQRMTNYVSGKVGDALGLDQLSVEGNLFNSGNAGGATLLASKNISDRAEITYTTGIGHINEQQIRLEYRLTRRLSVQGKTDQAGNSEIDFKYRLRYR